MIENGSTKVEDSKLVPVSEVKPIKKDAKKMDDKNTLEVGTSDYRRHKSKEKTSERSKTEVKSKEAHSSKEEKRTKEEKTKKNVKSEKKSENTVKTKETKSKSKSESKTRDKLSEKHKQKAVIEKTAKLEPEKVEEVKTVAKIEEAGSSVVHSNGVGGNAKPPNILVFAESIMAKDNVKSVLKTMVNREK